MPLLKIDMHVHTVGSPDAHTRTEDLSGIIKTKGLDGVAVTEHDNFNPLKFPDVLIIPGIEIIPHPYDPVCECVKIAQLKSRPDAVETMNADALSFHISNWLARRDADTFRLPQVGGSDSHIPQ